MYTIRSMHYWGVVFMLGLSINSVFATPSNHYPQLYENKASSENYEIVKLVDGPIDSVYSNKANGETIAQSGSSLWKINSAGEVIDYFRSSDLYASGLIIEKEGIIDWVFTGDKQIKPFTKTIDAKAYSQQQLFDAFDKAEAIEFVSSDRTTGKSTGIAYLYNQGQAWIMDIATQEDKIDDFYLTQRLKKDHNLRRDETDIRASKFKGYKNKNESFQFLKDIEVEIEESVEWKLKSVGFEKKATHRAYSILDTFFENLATAIFTNHGSRDYGYPVGYIKYELSHQNESIPFSIFADREYEKVSAHNFSWLGQESAKSNGLTFITINYRRRNVAELNEISLLPYYEKDVGLYAVRKKTPHNKNANTTTWQLSYSGFHSYDSIWGHVHFAEDSFPPVYYWFWQSRPIPEDRQYFWSGRSAGIASPVLKTLPESITFHWQDFKRDRNFRLVVNHRDAEFYKPEDTQVAITLYFDANELTQAFAQLKDTTHSIQLDLDLQERDFGGELIVSLKSQDKKIVLHNISFDYQEIPYAPKSSPVKPGKIQTELFLAYEESLFKYNPDKFLEKVNQLKQQNTIADYAAPLGYYFANLSLMFNTKGRFPENNTLFTQYFLLHQDITRNQVNDQQQKNVMHKNLMVLASQGIYLGSNSMNPDLNKKVIATFIEQNFNLEQETNRSLLFNVACYYATHHNKSQMLKIINRAVELGKSHEEFLKDNDFKDYLQDPDFINAIQQNKKQ